MKQPVLVNNSSIVNKRLYAEYVREVIISYYPNFYLRICGIIWIVLNGSLLSYLIYWGGPINAMRAMGIVEGIGAFTILPVAFFIGIAAVVVSYNNGYFSSYITKHRKWFFTNADNVRLEQIDFQSVFTEDGIAATRNGQEEHFEWSEVESIQETKHLHLLILKGVVQHGIGLGKMNIRTAIILEKNSYAKGDWQTLRGYLKQYGSKGLKKLILESEAEKPKGRKLR